MIKLLKLLLLNATIYLCTILFDSESYKLYSALKTVVLTLHFIDEKIAVVQRHNHDRSPTWVENCELNVYYIRSSEWVNEGVISETAGEMSEIVRNRKSNRPKWLKSPLWFYYVQGF